jgi:hypothetical protein
MRPRERRESGEQDLFRSRLDQVINMDHALVKLARTIDWRFLEEKFGAVYNDGPGQPPLPKRLMAGLAILKHTYNHSDEIVCELWIENRYYQYFCGAEFFQHRLPLDRSSMSNWRNRMGEERLQALLQDAAPPSSPSSAISRKITEWTATISPTATATSTTPSSPPPATTSAASSGGSGFYCASSWSCSSLRQIPWPPKKAILRRRLIHVRRQDVTEVSLAEHNNVVKAFPADRTDQPFSISILPRGARRRRSIANAH